MLLTPAFPAISLISHASLSNWSRLELVSLIRANCGTIPRGRLLHWILSVYHSQPNLRRGVIDLSAKKADRASFEKEPPKDWSAPRTQVSFFWYLPKSRPHNAIENARVAINHWAGNSGVDVVVVEEPSEMTETVLSVRLVTKTSPLAES
jgi:hypothetical protein